MRAMLRIMLSLLCLAPLYAGAADGGRSWRFRVWLDDREIGYHEFTLERRGGLDFIEIQARFQVRLLFLTLYAYEHVNNEVWEGECLNRLESRTDADGKQFQVSGERHRDRFIIDRGVEVYELPGCVKTFSYWDPGFLNERKLLNAQNGEWVDVEVGEPEIDRLNIRGQEVEAMRYRLHAGDLVLDLWYSADHDWLALESETAEGRLLRYELL